MPGPFPFPFGGGSGFCPTPDLEAEERRIRSALGVGVYADSPESGHGRTRRSLAVPLAYADADDWDLYLGGTPDRTLTFLAEWEDVLGLGGYPFGWTVEDRWRRARSRMIEYAGNNPTRMAEAFTTIVGAACYVVEIWYRPLLDERNRSQVAVLVPQFAWDDQRLWRTCEEMAARMEAAGGKIHVCVTHDGVAPPNRKPEFRSYDPTKTDHSLTGRDCTTPRT